MPGPGRARASPSVEAPAPSRVTFETPAGETPKGAASSAGAPDRRRPGRSESVAIATANAIAIADIHFHRDRSAATAARSNSVARPSTHSESMGEISTAAACAEGSESTTSPLASRPTSGSSRALSVPPRASVRNPSLREHRPPRSARHLLHHGAVDPPGQHQHRGAVPPERLRLGRDHERPAAARHYGAGDTARLRDLADNGPTGTPSTPSVCANASVTPS